MVWQLRKRKKNNRIFGGIFFVKLQSVAISQWSFLHLKATAAIKKRPREVRELKVHTTDQDDSFAQLTLGQLLSERKRMRAKAGYTANASGDLSVGTHAFGRNRRAHSCFKHLTIEYTFYGPPRLGNLVGNQHNECLALHDEQSNMYSFRMSLVQTLYRTCWRNSKKS